MLLVSIKSNHSLFVTMFVHCNQELIEYGIFPVLSLGRHRIIIEICFADTQTNGVAQVQHAAVVDIADSLIVGPVLSQFCIALKNSGQSHYIIGFGPRYHHYWILAH